MSKILRWCLVLLSFLMVNTSEASGLARHFGPPQGFVTSLLETLEKQSDPLQHGHPEGLDGYAAAEADRLVAMLAITDCEIDKAEKLFMYAYTHDPDNEMTIAAVRNARRFLYQEGLRRTLDAIDSEKYLLGIETGQADEPFASLRYLLQLNQTKFLYASALECDAHNLTARAGFARIWFKQHGSWTLSKKLGY